MQDRTTHNTTPTKKPRDENFPVASLVLARPQRAAILAFYRFVRMAAAIADDPPLSGDEKLLRLGDVEAALLAGDPLLPHATHLHAVDARHGAGIVEARQLLS